MLTRASTPSWGASVIALPVALGPFKSSLIARGADELLLKFTWRESLSKCPRRAAALALRAEPAGLRWGMAVPYSGVCSYLGQRTRLLRNGTMLSPRVSVAVPSPKGPQGSALGLIV